MLAPVRILRSRAADRAFTLIELLVVVAIIALLISILLPTLRGAREQGKRGVCLANLRGIGQAIAMYATDDRKENAIPIHRRQLVPNQQWIWRTGNWFTWGGRSAQKPFRYAAGSAYWFSGDPAPTGATPEPDFSAEKRPLNRYMFGSGNVGQYDAKKLDWFRCPSDIGYIDHPRIDDSPSANALNPCYDSMGNSYRASMSSVWFVSGTTSAGAFAPGPWGHRLTTMNPPSRIILLGEPTFFNMIKSDTPGVRPDPIFMDGWHKKRMNDNLAFLDGHAAYTNANGLHGADTVTASRMGLAGNNGDLISRGPSWQLDVYPTPGALIFGSLQSFVNLGPGWPWSNPQNNLTAR